MLSFKACCEAQHHMALVSRQQGMDVQAAGQQACAESVAGLQCSTVPAAVPGNGQCGRGHAHGHVLPA